MNVGDTFGPTRFEVTRASLKAYADASGDQNPIHQDEDVAKAVGLPDVIAHGMLTLGLVARAVARWTDGAEVVDLGAKFTNPVVVPADGVALLEVHGRVEKVEGGLATIAVEATCDGTKVLGRPTAVVRA